MHNQSVLKPEPIYFKNDFYIFAVYHCSLWENWYIVWYKAQFALVWSFQIHFKLNTPKI